MDALNEGVKPRLARIATDAATAENDDGNFMSDVAEAAEVSIELIHSNKDTLRASYDLDILIGHIQRF